MIVNTLGEKKLTCYVPAGATEAAAFAAAVLDGEYAVYTAGATTGSDLVNEARDVTVMIQNEITGEKGYLRFLIDTTKHEGDVITALKDKTFNGVKAEKVVIIGMRTVQF